MVESAHQGAVDEKTIGGHLSFYVIASEAKQSMERQRKSGLLRRGACHRARIRATRWLLAMTNGDSGALRRHDLVGDDKKLRQIHAPEAGAQRDVGSVPPDPHQDPADAGDVVPGIEGVPLAGKV